MKTLLLTLSKKPFEVMLPGEKKIEYRRASKWILSRLVGKEYDLVKFVNGYGKDKPYFICKFEGWTATATSRDIEFSNGLVVNVKPSDILIYLGEIVETGNLKDAK